MCGRREHLASDLVKHRSALPASAQPTGEIVGHYLDTDADRAHNGANVQRASQASERGRRARKAPGVGSPVGRLLFHVKRSDRRSLDSCQSVCSGCVAHFVRHVPCIPVPMRKRSNRADVKMKADLQRWLIESGEAEELVAFLREERARHPVPPPRVAVTTSLDVDIFDAMMARASSEGITSRSGALRAAVREWVRDVECQPESHED